MAAIFGGAEEGDMVEEEEEEKEGREDEYGSEYEYDNEEVNDDEEGGSMAEDSENHMKLRHVLSLLPLEGLPLLQLSSSSSSSASQHRAVLDFFDHAIKICAAGPMDGREHLKSFVGKYAGRSFVGGEVVSEAVKRFADIDQVISHINYYHQVSLSSLISSCRIPPTRTVLPIE